MQVIDELRKTGVKLWLEDKDICYEQEVEGINEDRVDNLLAKIKTHKEEAIQYLQLDTELTSLYESKLEDIASRYESGGLLGWLHNNFPKLYDDIQSAEDKLNKTWGQCFEGKATIDNFKAVLCQWHEAQMKGIEYYKQS